MKKIISGLVFIFISFSLYGQTSIPTAVVSAFSTRGQFLSAEDAESITELYIAEFAKLGKMRVVDRSSLDRVIAEMRFQTSDWSDPQKTARLGAALNADYIMRGQLNQLGDQISLAITALDINTLEVFASSNSTYRTNRIFDTSYLTGHIFWEMPVLAKNISDGVIKRIADRESSRQEIARQHEQLQTSLIGTWRIQRSYYSDEVASGPNQLEISFYDNRTFTVTLEECYHTQLGRGSDYSFVYKTKTVGNGYYERNGDILYITNYSYNINGIGWSQHYQRGRLIDRGWTPWERNYINEQHTIAQFREIKIDFQNNGMIMFWKPSVPFFYDSSSQHAFERIAQINRDSISSSNDTSIVSKEMDYNKTYHIQIGTYSQPIDAVKIFTKLSEAGFDPVYQQVDNNYQVFLTSVTGEELSRFISRLLNLGFTGFIYYTE